MNNIKEELDEKFNWKLNRLKELKEKINIVKFKRDMDENNPKQGFPGVLTIYDIYNKKLKELTFEYDILKEQKF